MLRFGLLGIGYWASHTHAMGLARHPEVEFAGVWGRDFARAKSLADSHGAIAYHSVDDLLANVDAVSIGLPPDVQAPLAVHAAAAGKHLLLEKPMALSVEQAQRIVEVVTANGVKSLVFVTRRFLPAMAGFIDQALALGGWCGGRLVHRSAASVSKNPYATSGWRTDRGGLWDIGPHSLGLLLPILGPVREVTAVVGPFRTHHLLLQHASSAVSSLELSINVPAEGIEWSAQLTGDAGVLAVPDDSGLGLENAYHLAVSRLIHNVAERIDDDPLDVHFGLEQVTILAAAEAAAQTGTTVSVVK